MNTNKQSEKNGNLPIFSVRQRALDWWNTLNHYKQNYFASKYHYQERLSVRYEIEKIVDVYRAVHDLN